MVVFNGVNGMTKDRETLIKIAEVYKRRAEASSYDPEAVRSYCMIIQTFIMIDESRSRSPRMIMEHREVD